MVGPYLVAVSAAVSVAATVLAWRHAIAVGRARGGDVAGLTASLKRVALPERPQALLDRAPAGSWQRSFAQEIVEAPDEAWKVAAANDAISDLGHALDLRAGWPRSAARVAAAAAFLCAIIAYIVDRELDHTLTIVVPGAVAIAACVEAGRRAKDAAKACRKDMDALVQVVMGDVAREQAEKSELRRRRRREGW